MTTTTTVTTTHDNLLLIDGAYLVSAGPRCERTPWGGEEPLRKYRLAVRGVTLRLPAETTFPKKYGKQVKAASGYYSDIRGNSYRRTVRLPVSQAELIDLLLIEYGPCDVLVHFHRDYVVKQVGSLKAALRGLAEIVATKTRHTRKEGHVPAYRQVTDADLMIDDTRYEREKHNHECDRLKATLSLLSKRAEALGLHLTKVEGAVIEELSARVGAAKMPE